MISSIRKNQLPRGEALLINREMSITRLRHIERWAINCRLNVFPRARKRLNDCAAQLSCANGENPKLRTNLWVGAEILTGFLVKGSV